LFSFPDPVNETSARVVAAGVVALAVPVDAEAAAAPAALGTALPLARYGPSRRDALLDELQRTGRAIASAWA